MKSVNFLLLSGALMMNSAFATELPNRPAAVTVQGWIDEASASKVVGWACLNDSQYPRFLKDSGTPEFARQVLVLRLYVDGQFVEQTSTGLVRTDVPKANFCNKMNRFAGFKFINIPALDPNKEHIFEVKEVNRVSRAETPIMPTPPKKSLHTGIVGYVETKQITKTGNGATFTIGGWACDTYASWAYPPLIRMYDDKKNLLVEAPTALARADTRSAGCRADSAGRYNYGFNFTVTLDRKLHNTFFDGMHKDYLVYGVDSQGVERPLTPLQGLPTRLGMGRANNMPKSVAQVLTVPYSNNFARDLESRFAANSLPRTGSMVYLGNPGDSSNVVDENNSVVLPANGSYPKRLAAYHASFSSISGKEGILPVVNIYPVLFEQDTQTGKSRLRPDWGTRLTSYADALIGFRQAGNIAYFYLIDEPFLNYSKNDSGMNSQVFANQLKQVRTALRKAIPNAKTMTTLAYPTYANSPPRDPFTRGIWESFENAFDVVNMDVYPISSVVPEEPDSLCRGVVDYREGEDMAAEIQRCQIEKMRKILPGKPMLLVGQGFLLFCGNASPGCDNESDVSVEENMRRMQRYNAALYAMVNQDPNGYLRGVINPFPNEGPGMSSSQIDSYLQIKLRNRPANMPNWQLSQPLQTNFLGLGTLPYFHQLAKCSSNDQSFAYQHQNGKLECSQ